MSSGFSIEGIRVLGSNTRTAIKNERQNINDKTSKGMKYTFWAISSLKRLAWIMEKKSVKTLSGCWLSGRPSGSAEPGAAGQF